MNKTNFEKWKADLTIDDVVSTLSNYDIGVCNDICPKYDVERCRHLTRDMCAKRMKEWFEAAPERKVNTTNCPYNAEDAYCPWYEESSCPAYDDCPDIEG